jgi:hypothetical protein
MADARYLSRYLDPLYECAGLAISTSSDERIAGDGLVALGEAISRAIADVRLEPEQWPVVVGHRFEPFQEDPGPPVVRHASRQRLLEFLTAVSGMIQKAKEAGG